MSDEKQIYLKYKGTGAAIWNVPARDLTLEETEKAQADGHDLLASGLYELAEEQKTNTEYPSAGGKIPEDVVYHDLNDVKEKFLPKDFEEKPATRGKRGK